MDNFLFLYRLLLPAVFLTTIPSLTLRGQSNDTWTAFWNKGKTLIGYKDKNGNVRIKPKFVRSSAEKFDNIIAVTEEIKGRWKSYYLTKTGKIVGRDSLFIFDAQTDCENEGFIRFEDSTTDKVGMFNSAGNIAIPAMYNALTSVWNGMIMGLIGAEKEYWDKDKHSGCNHYSWVGGQIVLLDTSNNILIENFSYKNAINFFTRTITKTPHSDTTRISFLAKDGSYYSFVDFEKEFRQWLTKDLLNNLTEEKLLRASYNTITWVSQDQGGWIKTNKKKLIAKNFSMLKHGLLEILESECDYFISRDGLYHFSFDGPEFEKYFNNCGEPKEWIYPTMSIIISHNNDGDFSQNHYEFLRTDDGYKLLRLTISNEEMKQ